MRVSELLIAAKAKIATPDKWTQGAYFRDARGDIKTYSQDPSITCMCSVGALKSAYNDIPEAERAGYLYGTAWYFLDQASVKTIISYNDRASTTHKALMSVWDRAIEIAQAKEAAE